jgi:ribonuclease P protein component
MTGFGAADATPAPDCGALGCASAPSFDQLRKRADFLAAAKGARFHAPAFSLQAIARVSGEASPPSPPRFGFTVTKKAGGAVERNRMRRRLREAVRRAAPLEAKLGFDYVIIARREALTAGFPRLVTELARAMRLIGEKPVRSRGRQPAPASRR